MRGSRISSAQSRSRSQWGWALLLLIGLLAAALRFWQLGNIPPGLYRDEAYNGLDALGVLNGHHALFFPANNGREPLYIYLTAASIALFGRTALAVRLAAAVVGTLTTWLVYKLAASWFSPKIGWFTAALWAITLWPIHLSRIGLRVILLVPMLTLALWLATEAYRRQRPWLWGLAGAAYGFCFYTYLAARITPVFGILLIIFLAWRGRWYRLWPGLVWFTLGMAASLLPFTVLIISQPAILFGRTGQVSILNPDINRGDFWGTLWLHIGRTLALFLWKGDDIIRHNPPGRPLFDIIMAGPFLIGLVTCLHQWRRPAATALLLWTAVMLIPTIIAEDAPHFLRAVGILPAALFFPALGLSQIASWPKLARLWRHTGVLVVFTLIIASAWLTIRDYFWEYGRQQETAYLFETAARDLAEQINAEAPTTHILADTRFQAGWPSIRFLTNPAQQVQLISPETAAPTAITLPAALFLWPHDWEALAQTAAALPAPALVTAQLGSLARGDLEPTPYPLFVRYSAQRPPNQWAQAVNFNNEMTLLDAAVSQIDAATLQVDLFWQEQPTAERRSLITFVQVLDKATMTLLGQSDSIPAQGYWPRPWWRPGLVIQDQHRINLAVPFETAKHIIVVGSYPAGQPEKRLPIINESGEPISDSWLVNPQSKP